MRHTSLILLALASALSFGFATPASAVVTHYGTTLTNTLEPNPTSPGTGSAQVTLDSDFDTVTVHVTFSGLSANASAGHIHCCTTVAGAGSVGVAVGFTGFPAATSGTYDHVFTLTAASFATVSTGIAAGKAYVNIHNASYPSGAIRGFLAPIPEPTTLALMLGGLGLVGWAAKRRQQA